MTVTAKTPVSLSQILQISLTVRDLDRAVNFYRDILGMRLLFQAPPKLAFFDAGGVRLLLSEPEAGQAPGTESSVLYFRVADIQAAHDALVKANVRFMEPPRLIARMPDHDLWMAAFRDSEDNLLALMSEVRDRAPNP